MRARVLTCALKSGLNDNTRRSSLYTHQHAGCVARDARTQEIYGKVQILCVDDDSTNQTVRVLNGTHRARARTRALRGSLCVCSKCFPCVWCVLCGTRGVDTCV